MLAIRSVEHEFDTTGSVMKPIRVAFMTNFIPPYWKPVLTSLSERYPNLRILVSTPMEPNRSWDVDWQGLDVVLQKTLTLRGKWRHPKGFREQLFVHLPIDTVAQLRRFRADVVISAEMGFRTLLGLLYRKLQPQSKLVIWAEIAESTERGRGLLRNLFRRLLGHQADMFIVMGESGARYLRTLHIQDSKILQIPYATKVHLFTETSLTKTPEQARRWLYVGQLIERKGLMPFLDVAVRWASANRDCTIEFLIAGDGPIRDELNHFACPANLRVRLLGHVPYGNVSTIYADSGVFVFPTLADTWGLVVNEAMASGLPVLGSVYSQAVEMLVSEGENGWNFEPDNARDTYNAIDRCMKTPMEELHLMRERARSTALGLTSEDMARRIELAVDSILAAPRRS